MGTSDRLPLSHPTMMEEPQTVGAHQCGVMMVNIIEAHCHVTELTWSGGGGGLMSNSRGIGIKNRMFQPWGPSSAVTLCNS